MQAQPASPILLNAKRIVVKVGSSLVTNEGRGLDDQAIDQWCEQLAALVKSGREDASQPNDLFALTPC